MTSVSQVEHSLKHILEERANVLAHETGCIERQRKFSSIHQIASHSSSRDLPTWCPTPSAFPPLSTLVLPLILSPPHPFMSGCQFLPLTNPFGFRILTTEES